MRNFWIYVFIVASIGVYTQAQRAEEYDNSEHVKDSEKEKDDADIKDQNDIKVDEEIKQYIETAQNNIDPVDESKKDYQYEDNRNKFSDEGSVEENDEQYDESLEKAELNDKSAENQVEEDEPNDDSKNFAMLSGDDNEAPLPVPETEEDDEDEAILEEARKILEEDDTDAFEEQLREVFGGKGNEKPKIEDIVKETKDILAESDDSLNNNEENNSREIDIADDTKKNNTVPLKETEPLINDEQPDIKEIIEETKQILSEGNDSLNDDENSAEETVIDNNDKLDVQENNQEDTIENAYADLNADLEKLLATLDKLKEDDSDDDVSAHDEDESLADAENIFESDNNDSKNSENGSEELVDDNNDYEIDLDKMLQNILTEVDMKSEDTASEELKPLSNDAINEPNPEDNNEKDVETLQKTVPYLNDALIDEPKEEPIMANDENVDTNASVQDKSEVNTKLVDDLSSAELEDLVKQFSILHEEDLDIGSESFDQNIAPVRMHLNLDEPTIITSPNYPNQYPTNNIVDWVMEGEGVGIELNITDFAVNGALGDYLLVKPGGIDESGHDGLIFTYRLRSERRYRFTDVDRLFMRFESKPGMQFFRGFNISAKMIAPISDLLEPIPEPEVVLAPPHSTATVTLAVSVRKMVQMKEDFRLILADMAEEYILANYIEPGLNSTIEVTQITSIGLCPISWPDFEHCSAVTFGISLEYEDGNEDLRLNKYDLLDMWMTYSRRDPFAYRLDAMSITEYFPPDSSAMTAWLVIAAGVVISMAMLAFVLWRYSCFEDYTRMRSFSDTDSFHNEKRNLDLYPTPHQTLPPLYTENEYKWQVEDDARVDLGGFANRSYADNMYDFDSDEEVISTRDRNGAVPAKDAHSSNV